MASTDTSTTNCAACGKEGGNLNTCNKCHLVKYCNAACKKKHRSKHKKACEKRVAELHYEHELFKEHPPREECPICFLPLPRDIHQSSFKSCCGKVICNGCIYAMNEARGRGKINLCAFCRTPMATSDADETKRIKEIAESGNAIAIYNIGMYYHKGQFGFPQDMSKANKLYLKAGELGYPEGYCNLGVSYENGRGVQVDMKNEES